MWYLDCVSVRSGHRLVELKKKKKTEPNSRRSAKIETKAKSINKPRACGHNENSIIQLFRIEQL